MRSHRPTPQQAEAVSRRLAQLSAELAVVRAESQPAHDEDDAQEWVAGRAGARAAGVPPGIPDTHTRIRDSRLRIVADPAPPTPASAPSPQPPPQPPLHPVEPVTEPAVSAPPVPMPGRHAARRPGAVLAELVPSTLRGRAVLTPGPLAVLAVAVALGLAVTCWWILSNAPEQVPAPTPVPAAEGGLITPSTTPSAGGESVGAPGAGAASGSGTGAAEIVVDVAGKVRRPGIAVLPPGSRVVDAVAAAGGAKPGVDLSGLNLARLLVDGEQILVGTPGAPGAAGAAPAPPASGVPSAGGALVNINTADQATLETLPGVGPVTAQAIIDWRTEHGGFSAVEELLEVSGIGDATLAELTPHVTV